MVVSTSAWHSAGRRFDSRTRHVSLGAIQVLRNADGGGGGVSDFLEKSVTKV